MYRISFREEEETGECNWFFRCWLSTNLRRNLDDCARGSAAFRQECQETGEGQSQRGRSRDNRSNTDNLWNRQKSAQNRFVALAFVNHTSSGRHGRLLSALEVSSQTKNAVEKSENDEERITV